jgi:hypothetical protein
MANIYFSVQASHRGKTQSNQQQVLHQLGQSWFLKGERLLQIAVGGAADLVCQATNDQETWQQIH